MSERKIELLYFDHPGRGEFVRLIFALKGIQYDDTRIKWPQFVEQRYLLLNANIITMKYMLFSP